MNGLDETHLLLELHRLDFEGEKLEEKEYDEEIQKLLEEIGEKQCAIFNSITWQ